MLQIYSIIRRYAICPICRLSIHRIVLSSICSLGIEKDNKKVLSKQYLKYKYRFMFSVKFNKYIKSIDVINTYTKFQARLYPQHRSQRDNKI